jgi:hypothetical protein
MVGDLLLDNSRLYDAKAGGMIDIINPGGNRHLRKIPEGAAEIAPGALHEHIVKIF